MYIKIIIRKLKTKTVSIKKMLKLHKRSIVLTVLNALEKFVSINFKNNILRTFYTIYVYNKFGTM